jgi:ferric-dicitrate binding protein FerR (iron transport regulator)
MLDELAKKARESMEPPWDDLREARGLKQALESWQEEPAHVETAAPAEPANETRWLSWAGAAAAVLALGISGYLLASSNDDAPANLVAQSEAPEVLPAPVTDEGPVEAKAPRLTLADGSVAMLSMDASVVIADETDTGVRLQQSTGEVRYEIVPNRERAFVVEAAGVNIEVVGTVFVVLITTDSVDVSVERGRVEVDDGARQFELGAGEKVSVRATEDDGVAETAEVATSPEASETKQASARELMKRHDDAKVNGQLGPAAEALRELIGEHPKDTRVPVAYYSLGRIEAQRGRHVAAARAFETYYKRYRNQSLAEDATAGAARSWKAAGKADKAAAAAGRYLDSYPAGLHVKEMRKIAD